MLENVIEDKQFASLMQKNIRDMIIYFFEKEQNFGILCRIEEISFEPELPSKINAEFRPLTLFFLAGYTFETALIQGDFLIFEAGFGVENIGSFVTVPLLSMMQIIIDETPVLINLASYEEENHAHKEIDERGVENSTASFLSNPENSKFLKK
ncbi:MAG: hypothetical protein NTW78_13255 [Campylobacterales bacterium]|nr:hypothetical protein [Campylobacterales bacterium]